MRVCGHSLSCELALDDRNEMIPRRLAKMRSGEVLLTMVQREGRLTARRLRPASRLDQKMVAVSSTFGC